MLTVTRYLSLTRVHYVTIYYSQQVTLVLFVYKCTELQNFFFFFTNLILNVASYAMINESVQMSRIFPTLCWYDTVGLGCQRLRIMYQQSKKNFLNCHCFITIC